jgi:hypothetical protein
MQFLPIVQPKPDGSVNLSKRIQVILLNPEVSLTADIILENRIERGYFRRVNVMDFCIMEMLL